MKISSFSFPYRSIEHEMVYFQIELASAFCYDADVRCERLIQELMGSDLVTQDIRIKKIADTIFFNKGYCAEHPLKRNE